MTLFYNIGHNPNTVDDAMNCLKYANAIEPDVHFTDGDFYMGEIGEGTKLPLLTYLLDLKNRISAIPGKLALIAFDTKSSDFDINDLLDSIRVNFSNDNPGVAILITRSCLTDAEKTFFKGASGKLRPNEGLGVDQNTTPADVDAFFKTLDIPGYTYADGITPPFPKDILFKKTIQDAINLRDAGNSFSLVYAWTIASKDTMDDFLDMKANGMIVTDTEDLNDEVTNATYKPLFRLAVAGDNPFGKPGKVV